jgi:orotate phosphoribosyltransferase
MVSNLAPSQSLEEIFLSLPHVFNFSKNSNIQFATKAFTPINLNLEIISAHPVYRQALIEKFQKLIPPDVDYLCGIESGGSYFASTLANILNKKLILIRKEPKIENIPLSRLVGQTPPPNSRICLIDDVLSTGTTLFYTARFFEYLGCNVCARIVFSYGFDETISKEIGIDIQTCSKFCDLLTLATTQKLITPKDKKLLTKYVKGFENYLTRKGII